MATNAPTPCQHRHGNGGGGILVSVRVKGAAPGFMSGVCTDRGWGARARRRTGATHVCIVAGSVATAGNRKGPQRAVAHAAHQPTVGLEHHSRDAGQ